MSAKDEALHYYIDPGSGLPFLSLGPIILGFLVGIFGFFLMGFKYFFNFFKKNFFLILGIIALVAIALFIFRRTVMSKKETTIHINKVIILGMDGLEPRIVEKLMHEGILPNFSRLKDSGSYSKLGTSNPPESAVAWTSFYTGLNPGKHGIYDFIMRQPENYLPYPTLTNTQAEKNYLNFLGIKIPWFKHKYIERYQKGEAFWNITSRHKIPTVILFCPNTFPPDKIYGRMLSGMGVTDLRGTMGTFSFYTSQPPEDKKDIGGQIYYVTVENNTIDTVLSGPRDTSRKSVRDFTVPMSIELYPTEKRVLISVLSQKIELKEFQWTDWIKVKFKLGPARSVSGICKFYLKQIAPDFQLYVTAVNIDPQAPVFPISYPQDFAKNIAQDIGLFSTLGMPHDTWALNENRIDYKIYLEQSESLFAEKKAILENELKKFKKGIFFFYFGTSDSLQHMFWRFIDHQHPNFDKELADKYGKVIEEHYQELDRILGEVIDRYIDENTVLIVLSDHGFNTFRRAVHINSWLRDNGFLYLVGDTKEAKELFTNVDWSRTQAYSVGFGGIYINQINREVQGSVYPGKETEEVKEAIREKLLQFNDPKTGKKVVNHVYTKEEIFWGPYTKDAPDLFLGFNLGFRASWQTALGAAPEAIIEDNLKNWGGGHLMDPALMFGILFVNRKITAKQPHIVDIVHTVLKIFNIELPQELDGKPLF